MQRKIWEDWLSPGDGIAAIFACVFASVFPNFSIMNT